MSVVVVATIYPKPEHRDAVVAAFEKAIARVHAEDAGCELYALHDGDNRLVMVEKWDSPADLDAHSRSGALKDLNADLDGKLAAALDVQVMQPHPAGTPRQGTL
jgi:quinol monooxygenase YgiN